MRLNKKNKLNIYEKATGDFRNTNGSTCLMVCHDTKGGILITE